MINNKIISMKQLSSIMEMMSQLPRYQGIHVRICDGFWTEEDSEYIKNLTEWEVKILRITWNRRPTLFQEISHIHFNSLEKLWIVGNQIESIHQATLLIMPCLSHFFIALNNIISITTLRKTTLASITFLSLHNNFFSDASKLSQGHFPALQILWLHSDFMGVQKNGFVDPFSPLKLQTCSLNSLSTHGFTKKLKHTSYRFYDPQEFLEKNGQIFMFSDLPKNNIFFKNTSMFWIS